MLQSLLTRSGGYWPGTSVFEMNSYAGVPLDKIVIGKPLDQAKASNGYMDPASLNTCVRQARSRGWNGGVMFWEWTSVSVLTGATQGQMLINSASATDYVCRSCHLTVAMIRHCKIIMLCTCQPASSVVSQYPFSVS